MNLLESVHSSDFPMASSSHEYLQGSCAATTFGTIERPKSSNQEYHSSHIKSPGHSSTLNQLDLKKEVNQFNKFIFYFLGFPIPYFY